MAISDARRSDLYTGLAEAIGAERAETLMTAIPLHDLDEIATKGDVASSAALLRVDLADTRADLRGEMSDLRDELKGEMSDLRDELKGEMSDLRDELRELRQAVDSHQSELIAHVAAQVVELQKTFGTWLLTALVTIVSAMVGLAVVG